MSKSWTAEESALMKLHLKRACHENEWCKNGLRPNKAFYSGNRTKCSENQINYIK
jgi:hypothetical protein